MPLLMITYRNPNTFLDTLPTEILQDIAGHLAKCDLLSLNMTSKALHRITALNLYRHLSIRRSSQLRVFAETVSAKQYAAEYTTRFALEDPRDLLWAENQGRLMQLQQIFDTPWTNLKVLIIDKMPMEIRNNSEAKRLATHIAKAVLAQPQLEQFAFRFSSKEKYPTASEMFGVLHHPNLRTITLGGLRLRSDETVEHLEEAGCVEPRLSLHLRLYKCDLEGTSLRALLDHVGKLRKFSLFDSTYRSKVSLIDSTYLLEDRPRFRDQEIIYYMEALRRLKTDLEMLTLVHDDLLVYWKRNGIRPEHVNLRKFKKLKHLFVEPTFLRIASHEQDGFKNVMPPNLEHLSVHCSGIDHRAMAIVKYLPRLKDAAPHLQRITILSPNKRRPHGLRTAAAAVGISVDTGDWKNHGWYDENW